LVPPGVMDRAFTSPMWGVLPPLLVALLQRTTYIVYYTIMVWCLNSKRLLYLIPPHCWEDNIEIDRK